VPMHQNIDLKSRTSCNKRQAFRHSAEVRLIGAWVGINDRMMCVTKMRGNTLPELLSYLAGVAS